MEVKILAQIKWCQEMLHQIQSNTPRNVAKIVMGDIAWVYQYEPETKHLSVVWALPGRPYHH